MPCFVEPSRVRLSLRFAALSVLAATAAGCSADASRFQSGGPFQSAQNHTPPAAVTGAIEPAAYPPANAAPMGRVESQPLPMRESAATLPPPPSRAASATPAYPSQAARPMRTATAAPPPPAARSHEHVVASGETLITIARRYRKTTVEVARANGLTTDSRVRIGQRLTIPGVAPQRQAEAARPPAAPPQRSQPAAPQRPQAAPAPTPTPRTAAPAPARQAAPPQPAERQVVTRGAPPANLSHPAPERVERAAVATPAPAVEAEEAATPSASGQPSFRWPVRGRVISGFGPRPTGQQNDGINLAVPEGTSVRAAEDGVVAYAGNELKGYGNLVLVRHSNGYVTAYAHASELKVKRGDRVRRGQIIALAGQTGGVSSPQLHFEIRRGSTPVDPIKYLASN
jgi:murein DD-endopeptidase MepM/ murein hydrolase activator NlpD